MNASQRKAFIDTLESAVAAEGFDLYEGAATLKQFIDASYPHFEAAQSRDTLDAYLSTGTESEDARAALFIQLVVALQPLLRTFAQKTLHTIASNTPTAPPGRPTSLTPAMRRQIIDRVSKLHAQGVPVVAASTRAAQQLGVSKSTVQRAWRQRAALTKQPFQSVSDILSFLAKSSPHQQPD